MKKFLFLTCAALCCFQGMGFAAPVNWPQNYQEAANRAKATSKPLVLFFTGSDWCSWCHKMEDEILNTPDFNQQTAGQYEFVLVDFPMKTQQQASIKAQNQDLMKRYNVQGFPTIVVVDPNNGQQLGSLGYKAGGGRPFANDLRNIAGKSSTANQKR